MDANDRGIDQAATLALAHVARLTLDADRVTVVAPALAGMYAAFDALDGVDLGETPPATAFDARWE